MVDKEPKDINEKDLEQTKEKIVEETTEIPSIKGEETLGGNEINLEKPVDVSVENSDSETENYEEEFSSGIDMENVDPVTVQPVEFAKFDFTEQVQGDTNKNLDLLMDVKLQLTVELGRTELPIKKVLELTRGSIIELDKAAGETVELYANGKHVANGEVVVIEDNFGLRITGITSVEERMKDF